MKKYVVSILAVLVLVAMLASPALAAGGSVTVSPATGASGGIVTITVSLSGFEQATALGIIYSGVPELVDSSSEWLLPNGVLEDIGTERKDWCAWAVSDATTINGDVLKLALRLPAYDGTKSYPVSVTVKAQRGSTILAEVTQNTTITVNNAAQSVTLDKSTLALDLAGTKTGTLTAAVAPESTTDTVVWSSSDASVASVANGTVTGLKVGTATVTATAGGKSASCVVTVSCAHTAAVKTEAHTPSCQETGNNAYWTCGDCGQVLAADKTTVTTVQDQTLGKKDHSFATAWQNDAAQHWHICTTCNTEKGSLADHSFQWVVDQAATEDVTGLKHEECTCGYKKSEGTVIPKLDHVHTGITKHAAVAATCVKTGTVEYWTCSSSKCAGKYYGDAQCQTELTTITAPVNAKNHGGKTVYRTSDKQHWQVCDACNAVIGQKADHSFQWVVDKAATEAATGLKHQVCSVCKLEKSKNTVIDKLPHAPAKVAGKAATCTEAGVAEHFHCSNCNGYYTSVDGKVGNAIKKDELTIPALGHSFGSDWHSDEKGHWHVCATCDALSETEAHTAELVGAVEATKETEGYTGDRVCTVCETVVEQGQKIPVLPEETQPPTEAPDQEPDVSPKNNAVGIGIAVALIVLAAVGSFLFVKKPWKK